MGVFDAINKTSSKALDHGQEYITITQKYYKLKAFQQVTRFFSRLIKMIVIGGLFFLGLIFLMVSVAIWFGTLVGSNVLGCLITAGLLFLFTILSYILRKQLDKKIIKKMAKEFFD